MKLIIIIGGGASGKMTVGQELCKITDLRLFHNLMTIDLVTQIFGRYDAGAIAGLRRVIFEEYAKSGNYGLVFTYIWDFSSESDGEYIRGAADIFKRAGGEVYLVELVADFEERLRRNRTENRLLNKPGKRNLEFSEALLYDEKPTASRVCPVKRNLRITSESTTPISRQTPPQDSSKNISICRIIR